MSIGRHHGDGIRFQNHQRAVQRVARFLVADGKNCFADKGAQNLGGNLDDIGGRKIWQSRKIGARHAHHFCVGPPRTDRDPVIFQQFDGDIAFGQQSHVVIKLARRNRAGAFFLHLGRAGGTQAEV